jgi:Flp pilus assembly protein TadB
MSPETSPKDAKTLWRNQPSEETVVTLENIRDRAEKFQAQVRRRNVREYLTAPVVVVICGVCMWFFPGWMMKTGSAFFIIAVLFVVWQLRKRGAARMLPENSGMPLVVFHREALIRQRDALRSMGTWYLAPFIPGLVLFVLGRYFQFHAPGRSLPWDRQIIFLCAIIVVLISGIIWLVNAWGAERLQRQIDQLDGLR